MAKSNLTQVFNIINNSDDVYQQKIVKNFISDLFQDTLMQISSNHNRPDFDSPMYNYSEHKFTLLKTFECQANLTTVLKFNAILSWEYDYRTEEYSELTVKEIIAPRIRFMKMDIDLEDFFTNEEIAKAIVHSANGIAVEEWDLDGVPQP